MRLECCKQTVDAVEEAIVDDSLIFVCCDLVLTVLTLLVDLVLLCADERALVDVWMDFNVGVVAELESILKLRQPRAWGQREGSS